MSSTQTPTKQAQKKHHHHHHSHKKQRDDQNDVASLVVPDSDDNQARYSDSASAPKSTKKPQPQTQRQILSDGEAITPAKAKPVNRHNKSVTKINTPKSASMMMYAGPAFHHSPAPSSLPTPKFAMRKASPIAIGETKPNEEAVQDEPLEHESRTVDAFGSGQSALAAMFQADREERRRVSTPQKDSTYRPDSSQSRPRTEGDSYGGVDDSVEKSAALRRLLGMPNTTPASDRDNKLPTPARSLFGGTPSHSQSHTLQPYSSATPPPSTYPQGKPASQSQRYTQSDYHAEWNDSPGSSCHSHPYPYPSNGPASPTPAHRTRQAPPFSTIPSESRPHPAGSQKSQVTQQTRDKSMEDQLKRLLKIGPDALSIDHQELG